MMSHCHQPSNSQSMSLSHFYRYGMSLHSHSPWNCSLTERASQILNPCLDMQLPSSCNSVMPARLVTCRNRPRAAPAATPAPWALHRVQAQRAGAALGSSARAQPTLTVGKPCWVRSLTEPRLPSVRYRALCWVSGCTMIFSSFPSLLVGYWPHNIGVFFPPAPFWFSDALRSQNTPSRRCEKQLPNKNTPNDRKAKKAKSAY